MSPIIVFLLSLSSLAVAWTAPTPDVKIQAQDTVTAEPETATDAPVVIPVEPVEKPEPATAVVTEPQVVTLPAMPAVAGNCQAANPPACAVETGGFSDNDVATNCRAELQDYITKVQDYSLCRRDALREISDLTRQDMTAAQDIARRTTQLFNCRLRGDTDCS